MADKIGKVLLLLVFAKAAYEDCKEKEIYVYLPISAMIVELGMHLVYQDAKLADILLGASVGGLLLLIAWGSRGSVGIGDGMMLVVSGVFLGFWGNVVLLMTALGMVGILALFLIVIKRKEKHYRLPFVPFLLVAYLAELL